MVTFSEESAKERKKLKRDYLQVGQTSLFAGQSSGERKLAVAFGESRG